MNPLRSVGARLGLALAVVVAGALILVDLIVVPSLERNLINANLTRLEEAAPTAGSRPTRWSGCPRRWTPTTGCCGE